jgi:hypothetical protein
MSDTPVQAGNSPGGPDKSQGSHDAWHQHTAAEGVPQREHGSQTNTKALGLTFLVMVFGTVAVIAILIVYFNTTADRFKARSQEGTAMMQPTWEAKIAARERLERFGWVDEETGIVHTPVSTAIDRVVEQYRNKPSRGSAAAASAPENARPETSPKESDTTDVQG